MRASRLLTCAEKFPISSEQFARYDPVDRVKAAFDIHGPKVVQLASMQKTAGVLMHLIYRAKVPVPILFFDTQYLHQETIDLKNVFMERYGLDIRTIYPDLTPEQQDATYGKDLWKTSAGQVQCCFMRKEKPLIDTMNKLGAQATMGGLMRSEGGARKDILPVDRDPRRGHLLYHPIFDFNNKQVHEYTKQHDIPVHPLYAQNYLSIGCAPCTTPVLPGEDERAGRWRHLRAEKEAGEKIYCGMNYSDTRPKPSSIGPSGVLKKPLFRVKNPDPS